ncbi:MFS transporter [Kordiimonas aestuarii]|uniref:MFS transporter n=1 Tax=Kordiimonas aestuarii TaxID=1005925 RepID=UPI0021CE5ED7|nr:glycoside-pentoside-hexuronide (GPH):cation symporter [Kordiimonas aestuarii]
MAKDRALRSKLPTFLGYGSGDFALNLFWQGTGFYLFYFFTNVLGLSGSIVGTIFLIASLWDAISDPMMGYIADRTKSRLGPYRPYLLFGSIPLSASFILLFSPMEMSSEAHLIAYASGALLLFRTAYTVVSIPYSALGARVTRNFDGRTRLAGIRMYFGFLGGVCVSFTAKTLQENFDDATAFGLMGLFAGIIAVVVLVACTFLSKESANPINRHSAPKSGKEGLVAIFHNRPFLLIVGGISLVTVATNTVGQTILYYFESHIGDRSSGNTAIIIMSGAPLLTIPFWSVLTLKIGKKTAWILGSIIGTIGLAVLYSAAVHAPFVAYLGVTITVIGLSAYAVIFWSILPDTIEYGYHLSGLKSESLLIGIASSFQKVSIGLSAYIAGHLLDLTGYIPATPTSAETTDGIRDIFTLIPMMALLASGVLMLFYPITAKSHAALVEDLQKREK